MTQIKKVFISYSWDSEEHLSWVEKLANSIEECHGIHVIWDGYDLDSCIDKNLFMEDSVTNADFTIIVATKKYCDKANNRNGGVGIETYLNTARHWEEMLSNKKTNNIVLLREPDSTPNYLKGHFYIDFTDNNKFDTKISELLTKIESKPRVQRPKKTVSTLEKKKFIN